MIHGQSFPVIFSSDSFPGTGILRSQAIPTIHHMRFHAYEQKVLSPYFSSLTALGTSRTNDQFAFQFIPPAQVPPRHTMIPIFDICLNGMVTNDR